MLYHSDEILAALAVEDSERPEEGTQKIVYSLIQIVPIVVLTRHFGHERVIKALLREVHSMD